MRDVLLNRGALTALTLAIAALAAHADGRIKFTIFDSESKKPIPGALIVLDPAESELSGVQFTADADGKVTTAELAPGVRGFRARATVEGVVYKELRGRVTILDNQDLEIDIELDRQGVIERKIQEELLRLDSKTTSNYTFRDRKHFQFYPLGVGNTLSLEKQLKLVPGLAADSLRRVHPRGENNNLALSVEGLLLPPTVTGRSISYLLPETIETLKTHVGGFSPSQGSTSGAFLETKLRPAIASGEDEKLADRRDWRLSAMAFGSSEASLMVSKQNPKDASGKTAGYWVTAARRSTGNALESPQDYEQLANNNQNELALAGKYEVRQNLKTSSSAFFTVHDGTTDVANRTGLDAPYFGVGQGYGFGGLGNEVDFPSRTPGIFNSQRILGNAVSQKDAHRLLALQHKTELGGGTRGVFTLGLSNTQAKVTSGTPNTVSPVNNLPADSSIEFLPTTKAAFNYTQLQADFTRANKKGNQELGYGLLLRNQSGSESYKYVPQSQAALNALRNIGDAALGAALTDFGTSGTAVPTLGIDRSGTYTAAYVQNTFEFSNGLRVNAGVRADNYEQSQTLGLINRRGKTTFSQASPRVSALYSFPGQNLVVRTSFGQLVTLPGTGQGAISLNPVKPQTTDQLDLSVEKQLDLSLFKLSVYDKKHTDTIGYRQFVVGPQQMAFSTFNAGKSNSKGWELSWEYNPHELNPVPGQLRDPQGLNGFILLANSQSRFAVAGDPPTPQEQGTTLTAGVGYHFESDFIGSLSLYRGSGLASSILRARRDAITEVNFKLTSPPNFFYKRYGMELSVENLLDGNGRYNFNSAFAGTRFQQGRRFTIGLFGQY